MGRPSDYTEEIADEICERIAQGGSVVRICQAEDMPAEKTVYNWLADPAHTGFLQRYRAARELQADRLFDQILEIADDSSKDLEVKETDDGTPVEVVNHEHLRRSRLRVDARKWMAARLSPKKYGDKVLNEHSGPDGGPIAVAHSITAEQVQDDLRDIFGAEQLDEEPAQPAAGGDPVVQPGFDVCGEQEPGAPAPGQAVAGEERSFLLADDDMSPEGP